MNEHRFRATDEAGAIRYYTRRQLDRLARLRLAAPAGRGWRIVCRHADVFPFIYQQPTPLYLSAGGKR